MSFELHKNHAYQKMSDDRKRDFWERTSILRMHGLVLFLDSGHHVRLASVTGRQHVLQNKIGLTFQDREDVDALLQELERPCEHRTVFTLPALLPLSSRTSLCCAAFNTTACYHSRRSCLVDPAVVLPCTAQTSTWKR